MWNAQRVKQNMTSMVDHLQYHCVRDTNLKIHLLPSYQQNKALVNQRN
jgi:hypothetical protein